MLHVKRIYDKAATRDGLRVLVDRLWPRGVAKADAQVDVWAKELAPSKELFAWFHADKDGRFAEFAKRYRRELAEKKEAAAALVGSRKRVTLVTAVKDIDHSHVPLLTAFLTRTLRSGAARKENKAKQKG